MSIKGVIFDFIGTTVIEKDPSVLNRCFAGAFNDHDVMAGIEIIKANRGKDKKEMIEEILKQSGFPLDLTQPILQSFRIHLQNKLDNFLENKGAGNAFNFLKKRKIVIGLGSGLPRDIFEAIFNHVGWKENSFDYIGVAEETGRGRPYPDMILGMMKKLNLRSDQMLKVGDTVADIQEGRNANVMTAAILSGTQDEKEIINSQPDFIIRSLTDLVQIFRSQQV
jgi:phosphonoacetaldehyde hydrolase